jgi:hypothetical protein
MFFSVGLQQDQRFSNSYQFGSLWVNCDAGWHRDNNRFYKGYADNYCEILVQDRGITVNHSEPRSFPMWFEHGFVTNLWPDRGKRAWASDSLHMDTDGRIVWTPVNLDLAVPAQPLTIDQAQQQIRVLLDQAVADLGHQPVKLFCSGGLDTFLIYSMLKQHGAEVELLQTNHFETDAFVQHNRDALEHYWSYRPQQLHHWTCPTWLATGGCGDEYFLRGPAVIAMLTAWHNIDFGALLQQHPDCYHYHHFGKYQDLWHSAWQSRDQLQQTHATREDLNRQIMDTLLNDHQHWHLGETVTWTPLKNIEIARILLQCDIQDLVPQFLDGAVTKQIITGYSPEVLNFVSDHKNHNTGQHMGAFMEWHDHA